MTTRVRRILRLMAVGWWLNMKIISVSAFQGALQVVWPLVFATTTFLMYRGSADSALLGYAALGASVMGTWSSISTVASDTVHQQRWLGTLELLVAAPTRFALIVIPMTTAMATTALYSVVATLVWARLLFGIEVTVASPFAFIVALVVTVLSISTFGFLLAVAIARYRTGWALGNLLEYPGWLLCGFLVPVDILPEWAQWVARLVPPTWGMWALRDAADSRSPWGNIAVCLMLGVGYAVVGALVSESVLRSARRHATLALT